MKVSCLQKFTQKQTFHRIQTSVHYSFLSMSMSMSNPSHDQTNKSQFADDAGQWGVSKNIDLAAEYLQRDLDKLARWCAKWRIKLNPEKTNVIIFSKSQTAIRAKLALSLYGDLTSYYPHIKFLGITFDNNMTFTKHFEEILERFTKPITTFVQIKNVSRKIGKIL